MEREKCPQCHKWFKWMKFWEYGNIYGEFCSQECMDIYTKEADERTKPEEENNE